MAFKDKAKNKGSGSPLTDDDEEAVKPFVPADLKGTLDKISKAVERSNNSKTYRQFEDDDEDEEEELAQKKRSLFERCGC